MPQGWGNIDAYRMVYNFWAGSLSGCYVGHGEPYIHPEDILWWAKGGVLHGESPERIAFLKEFFESIPYQEMSPDPEVSPKNYVFSQPGELYLVLLDETEVSDIDLPGEDPYKVDEIDTWTGEIRALGTAPAGGYRIAPRYPNYLLRFTPYEEGEQVRPEAKASAEPIEGVAPLEVTFLGEGGDTFHWDFDDGDGSEERNPTHTYRSHGVFTPTLRVTDGEGLSALSALSVRVFPAPPGDFVSRTSWPGSEEGLLFSWEKEGGAKTGDFTFKTRGEAAFTESGSMSLTDGALEMHGLEEDLLKACTESNQISIGVAVTSDSLDQEGPARVFSFSQDHGSRNFTLGQNKKKWVLRLRTSRNSGNATEPQITLHPVTLGETLYLTVSYFPGQMSVFANGEEVLSTSDLEGDFSTWGPGHHLILGDEWVGDRGWNGTLDHLSVYSRYVGHEEAKKQYELFQESEEKISK